MASLPRNIDQDQHVTQEHNRLHDFIASCDNRPTLLHLIYELYIYNSISAHGDYVDQFPLPSQIHETKKHIPSYRIFPQTLMQLAFALQLAKGAESSSYLPRLFLGIFWHRTALDRMKEFDHLGYCNITILGYEILTNKILDQLLAKQKHLFCFSIWTSSHVSLKCLALMTPKQTGWLVALLDLLEVVGSFIVFFEVSLGFKPLKLFLKVVTPIAPLCVEPTKFIDACWHEPYTNQGHCFFQGKILFQSRVEIQHFSLWLIGHE